jgi:hypothetical protein
VSRRALELILGILHFAYNLVWCAVIAGHCILPCYTGNEWLVASVPRGMPP